MQKYAQILKLYHDAIFFQITMVLILPSMTEEQMLPIPSLKVSPLTLNIKLVNMTVTCIYMQHNHVDMQILKLCRTSRTFFQMHIQY